MPRKAEEDVEKCRKINFKVRNSLKFGRMRGISSDMFFQGRFIESDFWTSSDHDLNCDNTSNNIYFENHCQKDPRKMPRAIKQESSKVASQTLIIDNGAYTIKAGFAPSGSSQDTPSQSPSGKDCHIIPNCIARGQDGPKSQKIYIADQLDSCRDFAEMAFRRPVEKGYLVNWDLEMDVWKQCFFDKRAKVYVRRHISGRTWRYADARSCSATQRIRI